MNYVEGYDLFGKETIQISCIKLNGVPTTTTEGAVGLLGMDVTSETKEIYKCTNVENGVFTWELIGESNRIASGKTAVFLGDSQTEANYHKTKIFHEWVKEILGLGTCFNFGLSGSTITNNGASSMSVRYANMPNNADIIFVMGGVNDVWCDQPLGSITDTTDTTYYGAVRSLCRNLKTKYPKKPIIFITPTLQNHSDCVHDEGIDVTTFATAMKEVCYREGVLCLDAHSDLGINPYYDDSYTTDGLHLNDLGNELLGKWIAKQVKNNVVIFESEKIDTSKLYTVQSTNDGNYGFHMALYIENNDVTNFATETGRSVTANIIFKNENYDIGGTVAIPAFGVDVINDLSAGNKKITSNSTGTVTDNGDGTKTLSITFTTNATTTKPYICLPNLISVGEGWSFELVRAYIELDGVEYDPVDIGGTFVSEILKKPVISDETKQ